MDDNVKAIGQRIREERLRLGLTQKEMAQHCMTSKLSQMNYESGKHTPNALYLQKADNLGMDIFYIITGSRLCEMHLTDDKEKALFEKLKTAPKLIQDFIKNAL